MSETTTPRPYDELLAARRAAEAAAPRLLELVAATIAALFSEAAWLSLHYGEVFWAHEDDTRLGAVLDARGAVLHDFATTPLDHQHLPGRQVPKEVEAAWGGREYRSASVLEAAVQDARAHGAHFRTLPEDLEVEGAGSAPCLAMPGR